MTHMTETSRRALLAGAGLAGAALIAPAAATTTGADNAEWTQAVANWHAAHATVMQYNAVPGGVDDDLMDQATSDEGDDAYRLAALPAPDRAGVGIKLNALLDYLEGCTIDIVTLRMIAADAIRSGEA